MRTTVDLDDELLRRARRKAAQDGRTLTAVIEEGLRRLLHQPPRRGRRFRLRWPVRRGARPPAIDPSDRVALYDRLDGRA